jgi:tripartite ATP-independent transporter DctM subunit
MEPLTRWLSFTSGVLILAMAFLILLSVFTRFIFNYEFSGLIELETFMMVLVGFLSFAYTTLKGGNVSVDLLNAKLSSKVKVFLGGVFSIWGFALFSIISWQSVIRAIEAYEAGERASISMIPYTPIYIIAVIGYALVALVLFGQMLGYLAEMFKANKRPWLQASLMAVIAIALAILPLWLKFFNPDLPRSTVGIIFVSLLISVMLIGFPIGFSMAMMGLLGLWYISGIEVAFSVLRLNLHDAFAHYYICVIPFFGLMGYLCYESGIGARLFNAASKLVGRIPGGLAIATIFGCGGFASICGDSMATAATMGSVALPEMKRYRYDESLATASVAAGGTLGILIPPSIGFIAYALVTEQSIAKLFMAGILPGIILCLAFALMVYLRCKWNPALGPPGPSTSLKEKLSSAKDVWPIVFLIFLVIGGIYSGIMPPTEAAALGTIGALVVAVISGGLSRKKLIRAMHTTTEMTAMILVILVGVGVLGNFFTLTDIPSDLAGYLKNLNVSRYLLLAIILFLYVILGMLMNIIPMVMVTLPVLFPTIMALGFDPIWFGVIMVIMMEMGQITPPVGMNVFVIHGIAGGVPMGTIFKGVLPFVLVMVAVIVLLTIFPDIALLLPNAMDTLAEIK